MLELGNIKININGIEYNANLEEYDDNSDSIYFRNNTTRELLKTRGRDSFYSFLISLDDDKLNIDLNGVDSVIIKGKRFEEDVEIKLTGIEFNIIGESKLLIKAHYINYC